MKIFNKIFTLLFLLTSFYHYSLATDYFWVGGSGDWSDLTHWATTSGGTTTHFIPPSPTDDVYFDANSGFVAGDATVTTSSSIYCRNMVWDGAPHSPNFLESLAEDFLIYGSLTLQADMYFEAKAYFTGSNPATITCNGNYIEGAVLIEKGGTSLTLLDDLTVTYDNGTAAYAVTGDINHISGTFDLNGFDVYAANYWTWNNNTRHLDMENSTFFIRHSESGYVGSGFHYPEPSNSENWSFSLYGSGITVNAANSMIDIDGGRHPLYVYGLDDTLKFHNVRLRKRYSNTSFYSYVVNCTFHRVTSDEGFNDFRAYSPCVIDSVEFNTEDDAWYGTTSAYNNRLYGSSAVFKTVIFNGIGNTPAVTANEIAGGNNTIGHVEFRNYDGLISAGSNTIGYAEFFDHGYITGNNNSLDTMVFSPGYSYRFGTNINTTINDAIYGNGNPCYLTEFLNVNTSNTSTLTVNTGTQLVLDYVRIRGLIAAGSDAPFQINEHSLDLGNNTNINFDAYNPGAPLEGIGPDSIVCPSIFPYTLDASGMVGNLYTTYFWYDGTSEITNEVTQPGTYWVSADYGRGCLLTDSVTLINAFDISFESHEPVCDLSNPDGSVVANVTGSTGPFTYSWNANPVQTDDTLVNVGAGTYVLTVTDDIGCVYQDSTTLVGPTTGTSLAINIPSGKVFDDCGTGTGSARAVVGGGSPDYQFTWNTTPVTSGNEVYNLTAGTYTAYVTDSLGCIDSASVTINSVAVSGYSASINVVDPSGCDTVGFASLNVSGGSSPFDYEWSHDSTVTLSTANDIPIGNHYVNIIDNQNCLLNVPFDVESGDLTAPVATGCLNDTVISTEPGMCEAVFTWTPPTYADDCFLKSVVASHQPGHVFKLGSTTVSYIATDYAGNIDTCSFVVTVEDQEAPMFTACPTNRTLTATIGNCLASVNWAPPIASDNCSGVVSVVGDFSPGDAFPVGATTVTYVATDAAGNTDTCRFNIYVKANPSNFYFISTVGNTSTGFTSNQECVRSLTLGTPQISNLCGNYWLIPGAYLPGGTYDFPIGQTDIEFAYTNGADTIVNAFYVLINDNYNPTFTDFPPYLYETADTCGGANVTWTEPVPFDACGIDTMYSTHQSGDFFPLGNTYVYYTVIDVNGRSYSRNFRIHVSDPYPVISNCPSNIVVNADTCGGAIVQWVEPTVEDNCLASFTSNYSPGDVFPFGSTQVTYTATDVSGYVRTCNFWVTVNQVAVQITNSCPSDIVVNLDSTVCDTALFWTEPTFNHPCGFDTIYQTHTPGDVFAPGNYTVEYEAVTFDGLTKTCSFNITVNKSTNLVDVVDCQPYATLTYQVDTAAMCGEVYAAWVEPSFITSFCSNPLDTVVFTSTIENNDTIPLGFYYVNYEARDEFGNALANCNFYVNVVDTISGVQKDICPTQPVINYVDISVNCDSAAIQFDEPMFSAQGCLNDFDTVVGNYYPGDLLPTGTHYIYYEARDGLGFPLSTCSFELQVIDTSTYLEVTCPETTYDYLTGYFSYEIIGDTSICGGIVDWDMPVFTPHGCMAEVDTIVGNYYPGDTLGFGLKYIEYYALDAAGNVLGSCSFQTNVFYDIDDVFILPMDTVLITNSGSCTVDFMWDPPQVIEACQIHNGNSYYWVNNYSTNWMSNGLSPFNYLSPQSFPIGSYSIDYWLYMNGHYVIYTFNIEVIEGTAPTFNSTCPSDTVTLYAQNNICDGIATWTNPTAVNSNCSGSSSSNITLTSNYYSGDLVPVGYNDVVYTATNASGASSTCEFVAHVIDVQAPMFTNCPLDKVVYTTDSTCSKVVTWKKPGVFDNCPSPTVTSTHNSGDEFPLGVTEVKYFVVDDAGQMDSCIFTVTVIDNVSPVIENCPSDIIVNATTGNCGTNVTWTAPTASDNCSISSFVSSHAPGSFFPVGNTTVTYTAIDGSGVTTQCSFVVTVQDVEAPTFVGCPSDITVNTNYNLCTAIVGWTPPTVSDNCGGNVVVTSTHVPGSAFNLGTTQVVYYVQDANGNQDSCSFNVTVQDVTAPQITGCPNNIVVSASAGQCSADVTWMAPLVFDNCAGANMLSSHNSGDTFNVGTTTVTYTATDAQGLVSTCSFTVTVLDDQAPELTCPSDIVVDVIANCDTNVVWTAPTATDNCGLDGNVVASHTSGDVFSVGTTQVSYTFTDLSGNSSTCTFNVTVNDASVPEIVCPADITVSSDPSECGAIVTWTAPVTYDNCNVATVTSNYDSGDFFGVGTTTVTYTVTDVNGLTTNCSFTVTVEDQEAPSLLNCPTDITVNNTYNLCATNVVWTAPVGLDNCSSTTITSTHNPGDEFEIGTTLVTYYVEDAAGNVDSCSFNVIVEDTQAPQISACPGNITVNADSTICGAEVTWVLPVALDNCAGVTLTSNYNSGDVFPVGTTTVTYTATDVTGLTATCSFNVTVVDVMAPVLTACPSDIHLTLGNACDVVATWTEPSVMDNCAGVTLTSTYSSGDSFGVGITTVTYTATDASGNQTTCSFNVVVTDDSAPVINACPTNITTGNDAGSCNASVTWTVPTATDNCGTPTMTSTHNPGDIFPIGTTTVTYTFTDVNGLSSTCSFTVTVEDTEAPSVLNCPSDIVVASAYNTCSANVSWIAPTAGDNCSGVSALTSSHAPGNNFPVGVTTVYYYVSDAAGNQDTCSFTVTVLDNEAPHFTICPNDIVVNAGATACEKQVSWTLPIAADNCSGVIVTSTHNSGATFPVGTTVVTYTATDASGNTATCVFNVTVEDNTAPIISGCPSNITVSNDANDCGAVVTWTAPSAADNCNLASFTSTHNSGAFFPIGSTVVTYTAVDNNGLSSTCSFTVTVTDNDVPFFTACPSDIVVNSDLSSCSAQATWTAPILNDNCPTSATIVSTHTPGSIFPLGTTTVTYTVTDASGNIATCSFNVTVQDATAPEITACPSNLTVFTDPGSCDATVYWISPIAIDNCSGVTLSSNYPNGSVLPLGTTTITYTATDAVGLTSTCSFNVTVVDNQAPVFDDCPADIVVDNDSALCEAIVTWTTPTATDNCGNVTVSSNYQSGDVFPVGTSLVTYTAVDENGLSSTCSFTVTVEDREAPLITDCPKDIFVDANLDSCGTTVTWTIPSGTDNCGLSSVSSNYSPGDFFEIGNYEVVYTFTDVHGNTETCIFYVEVAGDENNCFKGAQINVPEAFTPDGDGVNDVLVIEGIEDYPDNRIVIFNRWGTEVYEMVAYQNDWDGTVNKGSQMVGEDLPTGTYFYVLYTGDVEAGIVKGFIYLQR
ncbi:gliding motility-associated C-terminal domain-containing protein [Lishizhenia tianjinensis]|uniref:Gliding motility-associated C-terminal domain-containing protein n=1 Tax=Lishizhenia tianjinensis TaxID=477690 RepID=A0A1I6ZL99_9FLAO|nr:HYR domain-containing protein [Lishizhenia tianjinensis]SFT63392.1 gliding motility-associated C-terminal domain-containing protein [Lishizhenia tianjinensis]